MVQSKVHGPGFEVSRLDLRFRSYLREGVKFVIPGLTKTRTSGPPKEVLYPSYPEDEKLCPVQTLESYELRTKQLRLQSTEESRLCQSANHMHQWKHQQSGIGFNHSWHKLGLMSPCFQHTLLEVQLPPKPKEWGCPQQIFWRLPTGVRPSGDSTRGLSTAMNLAVGYWSVHKHEFSKLWTIPHC